MSVLCSIILTSSISDCGIDVVKQLSINEPSNFMFLSRISLLTISAVFETCNAPVISLDFNNAGLTSSSKFRETAQPFYVLEILASDQETLL